MFCPQNGTAALKGSKQGVTVSRAQTVDYRLRITGGGIVNRTYDIHKNLYIQPFFLTIFGPVNYGPP